MAKSPTPTGGTINEQIAAAALAGPKQPSSAEGFLRIPLETIGPHPDQPRTMIHEDRLKELMASIQKAGGLLQPINVRPARAEEAKQGEPNFQYRLVSGQRRLEAYRRLLGASDTPDKSRYSTIPAIVILGRDEVDALRDAIIENLQRDELAPLDAAEALANLKRKQGLKNHKEVAAAVGLKEDRVKRLLRLNEAPAVVKDAVRKGLTVTVLDEKEGATAEEGGGRERRETLRRLDLMEALEFGRLYDHHFERNGGFKRESSATKAAESTKLAIARALSEGWGFRRIQEYVEAVRSGRDRISSAEPTPLFTSDAKRVVILPGRLDSASEAEKTALREILTSLLAKVGPDSRGNVAPPV